MSKLVTLLTAGLVWMQASGIYRSMRTFHVADLRASGELHAIAEYSYAHLQQIDGADTLIADFSRSLYAIPDVVEMQLGGSETLKYRWHSSSATSGTSSLRDQSGLISFGLLASGLNRDADRITLAAFQDRLLRELHGTEYEPAFDLLHLAERPLLVTIGFNDPEKTSDQILAALADRCFAAAYFRYLGLA